MLHTTVDSFMDIVRARKRPSIPFLAHTLKISSTSAEYLASLLEKARLVEVHYPLNILQKPYVTPRAVSYKDPDPEPQISKSAMLDSYSIEADYVPANIRVARLNDSSYYMVEFESLSFPTRAFLDQIRDELSNKMPAISVEYSDIEKTTQMKNQFFKSTQQYLGNFQFDEKSTNLFAGLLLHRMFGLGEIDVLTHDDWLEEIAINNSATPISVYHRKFGWLRTNLYLPNEEEILNFASQIGRKVGRQIAILSPIMDARLESGDRVCATLSPISSHGNTITIRRFARNPWTIISLLSDKSNTMTSEMAAMLWVAFHYELNVIVAGGTASGKTSALNALCAFFPPNQRIVTIEDTREIMLPEHQWNWVPLITRNPNAEGLGEVTMLDLLVTSLRMRPDRIILGEMRRAPEAEVLFEAMHTGHSTYSTMHADTSAQVLRRLTQPPMAIPPSELSSLHLLIVQYRDRRKNLRRTLEISEVVSGSQSNELTPNIIYRWRPRSDTFDKIAPPTKFYNELNLHTGMTEREIDEEIKTRAGVLDWMKANDLSDISQVGAVFNAYYLNPYEVVEAAQKNKKPDSVIPKE